MTGAIAGAIANVFVVAFVAAVLALLVTLLAPRQRIGERVRTERLANPPGVTEPEPSEV
jgi:hypothetical protein